MQSSHLCAPAGTAVIRDVRCWHGGTANRSNVVRPMTSAGYVPHWFRPDGFQNPVMPRGNFERLGERGSKLCRGIVKD